MTVISNLGVKGEFKVEGKEKKGQPINFDEQSEVYVDMDIKPNEAVTTMFGSYGIKTDDNKNITSVWLQGLGCEVVEDFVEEII